MHYSTAMSLGVSLSLLLLAYLLQVIRPPPGNQTSSRQSDLLQFMHYMQYQQHLLNL